MSEDFIEVKRYKCKHCGKDFKTTYRHDCKWKPSKKNCLTCKHCIGFLDGHIGALSFMDYEPSIFECDLDNEGYNDISDLANNNWSMGCDDYEQAKSGNYLKRYGEIMRAQDTGKIEF